MEHYKIEKNIPITACNFKSQVPIDRKPVVKNKSVIRNKGKYPFRYMDIGDSFVFPLDEISSAPRSAYSYGKRHDMKFTFRTYTNYGRLWRIAKEDDIEENDEYVNNLLKRVGAK